MKNLPLGNFAISIAHPSQELNIYGLMERTKPFLFVMTDGSGRNIESRILNFQNSFQKIHTGNKDCFSTVTLQPDPKTRVHITNQQVYSAILNGKTEYFEFYAKSMAHHLVRKKIDFLIIDANEGYNVSNDICTIMGEVAVKMVKRLTGRKIVIYEHGVTMPLELNDDECICIDLTEEEIKSKKEAMLKYPISVLQEFHHIYNKEEIILEESLPDADKAQIIFDALPAECISKEYIRPLKEVFGKRPIPSYEAYGQKLVSENVYEEPILYDKHILPIKRKLEEMVYETAVLN